MRCNALRSWEPQLKDTVESVELICIPSGMWQDKRDALISAAQ